MAKTSSAVGDSSRDQKLSRKTELVECGYEKTSLATTLCWLDGAACDYDARSGMSEALKMLQGGLEMTVLCDVTPCSFTGTYKCFVRNCCHNLSTFRSKLSPPYSGYAYTANRESIYIPNYATHSRVKLMLAPLHAMRMYGGVTV
jgi:hypothetical protein